MNDERFLSALLALLLLPAMGFAWQTKPSAFFDQNCSACHTIAGGPSVGPDLKNVTQRASRHWLVEFIRDPEAQVAAKDPYAIKIVVDSQGMVMTPSPDVTEEFGEALLEYIDQQSGPSATAALPVLHAIRCRACRMRAAALDLTCRAHVENWAVTGASTPGCRSRPRK